MSDVLREAMKSKAAAKRFPEFQTVQQELVHKMTWANMMREAGRLTKKEFQEFESHLASEYIDAMPTEVFVEMQKDGSFADLEIVARAHDGERHGDDVRRDRAELNKKITRDALDEAFASQKIDSKRYNEEHRAIGSFDDDRTRRITDSDEANDGDAVALDIFFERKSPDRHITQMGISEAEHFTLEQRDQIIRSYPVHERDARTKGIPIMGSGRIFPISEESITCEPFEIPDHFPRIGGMDFGWDHPFAAVELAWDRDQDIIYVIKAHRLREATPVIHAGAIRSWGTKLPWAWPRDGRRETLEGAGVALAEQYTAQGLNMLYTHAQFQDGSVSVEAGLMQMLTRMETGKFKVFSPLLDWFEEFRLYHRKDGKVVKEGDDLLAATRYAVMMLRFAEMIYRQRKKYPRQRPGGYSWLGA